MYERLLDALKPYRYKMGLEFFYEGDWIHVAYWFKNAMTTAVRHAQTDLRRNIMRKDNPVIRIYDCNTRFIAYEGLLSDFVSLALPNVENTRRRDHCYDHNVQ